MQKKEERSMTSRMYDPRRRQRRAMRPPMTSAAWMLQISYPYLEGRRPVMGVLMA